MASPSGHGQPDLTPYYPLVRDYLRRFESRGASAEDLAQQTYFRAYRGLDQGSVPRHTKAWLLSIARHVGYEQIRSDHRRYQVSLDDALESVLYDESVHEPVETILDEEAKARLRDAIARLSRKEQLLVRAYYDVDRERYDPATQFGMPASRAKVYVYRIRKRLRRVLEGG